MERIDLDIKHWEIILSRGINTKRYSYNRLPQNEMIHILI